MVTQLNNLAFCSPVALPNSVSIASSSSSIIVTNNRRPTFPTTRRLTRTQTPIAADGDATVTHNVSKAVATPPSIENTTPNSSPLSSSTTEENGINVTHSELNGATPTTSSVTNNTTIDPNEYEFSYSIDEISQLVDTVDAAGLADFRYEHQGFVVEITRPGGLGFDNEGFLNKPVKQAPVTMTPSSDDYEYAEQVEEEEDDDDDEIIDQQVIDTQSKDLTASNDQDASDDDPDAVKDSDLVVTSTRVGFFFCGAKNKPPLVNVGDTVAYNQPVCIIEQLGQQYVYLSEAAGKVIKVYVEDGDAVEYGSEIMVIRPD